MYDEPSSPPTNEMLEESYADWSRILYKYGINKTVLENIRNDFNRIINSFQSDRSYFMHGDFASPNFVQDEYNELILIDWQSYQLGDNAELAYFISRGLDMGIAVNEEAIKNHYIKKLSYYIGKQFSMHDFDRVYNKCNFYVDYLYSAHYIQDSPVSRVQATLDKMVSSYEWLLNERGCS